MVRFPYRDMRGAVRVLSRAILFASAASIVLYMLVFRAPATVVTDELPRRVFQGSIEEEQRLFVERDLNMFQHVFQWIENVTYHCENLTLFGDSGHTIGGLNRSPGSKLLCVDPPMTLNTNSCLAVSFGLYDGLPLEFDLADRGCEVHALDPRAPKLFRKPPSHFHYYPVRLSRHGTKDGAKATLDVVLARLVVGERALSLLHVDVDGSEAEMLLQQLFDNTDGLLALHLAQQIALSVHISADLKHFESLVTFDVYENAFQRLAALGFKVASFECVSPRLLLYPGVERPVCGKYNVVMVKKGHDTWDRLERGNVPMRLEFMSKRF